MRGHRRHILWPTAYAGPIRGGGGGLEAVKGFPRNGMFQLWKQEALSCIVSAATGWRRTPGGDRGGEGG